ncbi:MAG: hypothetical protein KIT09_20025 [Bryobacteraceae bacterium]|nr:hypothetical protein [Bryobacteraceae bacterium]
MNLTTGLYRTFQAELTRQLREKRIIVAPRQGWVRSSPHFYVSPEEIDGMLEALP